jgi:predicted DNA-binding transcriptional regulator AlpA
VRQANRLTARKIAALVKSGRTGRHPDGHNLYFQISQWGPPAWVLRYGRNGKERYLGLGPLHSVSLAEARVRARQARQLLLDGKDPIEVKREARDKERAEARERLTFKDLRFLRLPAVEERTGLSRSDIYEKMRQGLFPRQVHMSERVVGWVEAEITQWQLERIAQRDQKIAEGDQKAVRKRGLKSDQAQASVMIEARASNSRGRSAGRDRPVLLQLAITRKGVLFIWPLTLPSDENPLGRSWHESALKAAEIAKTHWVRITSDRGLNGYRVRKAEGNLSEPEWPTDKSFSYLLMIAFSDRIIMTEDHPVVRKLRGLT